MNKFTRIKDRNGLLFFVKYPKKGTVKSRLSDIIDDKIVLTLYKKFVEDILDMLKKTDYSVIICFYPKDSINNFKKWLGNDYIYIPQTGNNLGERLKNCFIKGFDLGYNKLTVIGSDSPDLPLNIILESFKNLNNNDSVIGPCRDGGYYLIGFNENSFLPEVFDKIPWSTSEVFKKSINILNKSNYRVHILPRWYDIDTTDDLLYLYNKNQNSNFKHSKTIAFLSDFFDIKDKTKIGDNNIEK